MNKPVTWSQLPTKVLADVVEFCDGYSILPPKAFIEAGVPAELVAIYTRRHESHPTHWKSQIFDKNGRLMHSLTGVYCLTILREISRDLGLPSSRFDGRGSEASDLQTRILEHLGVKS